METIEELPPIDERLALPEAGYEIIDGVVTFVVPSDPPHGERHSKVSALVETHAHPDFKVASDMLTRTSKIDDIAPDVSVFPRDPDPVTGRRQLEQLTFEIISKGSMSRATTKAAKLARRGVRRVVAVDIERGRVVEWSRALETWEVVELHGHIVDPVLAVPLSVQALLNAGNIDDDVARALIAKRNPVIERTRAEAMTAGRANGRVESVLALLSARGFTLTDEQRHRIALRADRDDDLEEWMLRVATCASIDDLIGTS